MFIFAYGLDSSPNFQLGKFKIFNLVETRQEKSKIFSDEISVTLFKQVSTRLECEN